MLVRFDRSTPGRRASLRSALAPGYLISRLRREEIQMIVLPQGRRASLRSALALGYLISRLRREEISDLNVGGKGGGYEGARVIHDRRRDDN